MRDIRVKRIYPETNKQGLMFYNWRYLNGYNAKIKVVIGGRGLGKTFACVLSCLRDFANKKERFVYVVETLDDVKTLSQNKGERFFSAIKDYLSSSESTTKIKLYKKLFGDSSEIDNGETDLVGDDGNKVIGGTIKVGGETAGYLIAINAYGNLKRNNFSNIKTIIIDEFIPEEIDIRHLQIAKKVVSVVQTVARRKDINIIMLGNSIRLDDVLLVKLGLDNMRVGEVRLISDKYGLLIIAHYVDMSEYPKFKQASEESVAGRLATLLGEDNLDKNIFRGELNEKQLIPDKQKASQLFVCLHGQSGSVRINITKDHSEYYVLNDYGKNRNNRICIDKKYQTDVVQFLPMYGELLLNAYTQGKMRFESSAIHLLFKTIMKLDINV